MVTTALKWARPVNREGDSGHGDVARPVRSDNLPAGAHGSDGAALERKSDRNLDNTHAAPARWRCVRRAAPLPCRTRVLLGPGRGRKGPPASCSGDRYVCEGQLDAAIEAQSGSLSRACTRLFGSGFAGSGIDQT